MVARPSGKGFYIMRIKRSFYPAARLPALLALLIGSAALYGCSPGDGKKEKAATGPQTVTSQAATQASADTAVGKEIYFRYCHFCHGQKGRGDGPVGIALTPHPADFVADTKRMSKTDNELYESITVGIHKEIGGEAMSMPRWADILSEKERWSVLAFIRQLEREGKQAEGSKK